MVTVLLPLRKELPGLKAEPDFPWSRLWLTKLQEFPSVGRNAPRNSQRELSSGALPSCRNPTCDPNIVQGSGANQRQERARWSPAQFSVGWRKGQHCVFSRLWEF